MVDRPTFRVVADCATFSCSTVREDVRGRKFSGQDTSTENMKSHGSTRHIIGTGPYMSYEYVSFGHVSEKVDSFAAGIVLIELLTNLTCRGARELLEMSPTASLVPNLRSAVWQQKGQGLNQEQERMLEQLAVWSSRHMDTTASSGQRESSRSLASARNASQFQFARRTARS